MNHQQGDNVQIGKINTEITNVQAILNSTQEQIRVTQNELDRVCIFGCSLQIYSQLRNELQKLRRDVEEAEKRVKKKRKRKNRWILGAILTAGLLSSVAIGANKALHVSKVQESSQSISNCFQLKIIIIFVQLLKYLIETSHF